MELTFRLVEFATPHYDSMIKLRDEVLRKPLKLEFTIEQISEEYDQLHLGAYHNDTLVGVLVLKELNPDTVKMRQVAVDPNIQKMGIGKMLVKEAEIVAKAYGFKSIVLSARDTAIPFYEKLDYKTRGSYYEEVGIRHKEMFKEL